MVLSFGEQLEHAIRKKKLSRKEIAHELGITSQALSNYILNKRFPNYITLKKIIIYFNLDANIILNTSNCHTKDMYANKVETDLILNYRKLSVFHQVQLSEYIETLLGFP